MTKIKPKDLEALGNYERLEKLDLLDYLDESEEG